MDHTEAAAQLVAQFAPIDGMHATAIPRLNLIRMSRPTEPLYDVQRPAVCIIVQGAKQVMVGERIYTYDEAKHLVVSVDVPITGMVQRASADRPYLCVFLELDPVILSGLLLETGSNAGGASSGPGIGLSQTTPEVLGAVTRLVGLLASKEDAPFLAPLAEREILYRLLQGDQGDRLREIANPDSRLAQVNRAIAWIKRNYDRPFSIEVVAEEARMSASSLHQHFKAVTALSPLQYQKQLRLQEARRLILGGSLDAASAGHTVGYESPSQFSREYSRLFGEPPLRDAARLRANPQALTYA